MYIMYISQLYFHFTFEIPTSMPQYASAREIKKKYYFIKWRTDYCQQQSTITPPLSPRSHDLVILRRKTPDTNRERW